MEESKELQGFYKIFRAVIYDSILMEFFAYALEPEQLDFLGGVVTFDVWSKVDIHGRIKQCKELQENKYSVNIPMRYYYKGKFRRGWVNIVNPFRGTWVVGTPGSGKTFSIIEPFIRQHSKKGFAMVVYDYKFPTLATKLYCHYLKNKNAKDSKMLMLNPKK